MNIKRGDWVRVEPFKYSKHLFGNTVIKAGVIRQHNGYRRVQVADIFEDEVAEDPQVDVYVGKHGDVDTVPMSACRLLDN